MADARDAEGSVTGIDQGRKHGEGGSKTTHMVTVREEEIDHATITEVSVNVSAIYSLCLFGAHHTAAH
jgi:hypothetical protein